MWRSDKVSADALEIVVASGGTTMFSLGNLQSTTVGHHLGRMPVKRRSASPVSIALRVLALPLKVVIAVLVFIDEITRPIYRPIVDRVLAHPFFAFLDRQVSLLPRWAILIVFAVPFLVAEPLKLVAVILFAKGRTILGVITFLIAQLLTFVLVERIFHAGRAKLLSYGWFAWGVGWISRLRDAVLAAGRRVVRRVRVFVRLHARR